MNWAVNSVRNISDKIQPTYGTDKGQATPNRGKKERQVMASHMGRMTMLKSALEVNLQVPPGESEIEHDMVQKALVPKSFSKPELDSLLLEASAMTEWFLVAGSKTIVFNLKNINLS